MVVDAKLSSLATFSLIATGPRVGDDLDRRTCSIIAPLSRSARLVIRAVVGVVSKLERNTQSCYAKLTGLTGVSSSTTLEGVDADGNIGAVVENTDI